MLNVRLCTSHAQRPFSSLLPYSEDFESYSLDTLPKYFSDMEGSFAVASSATAAPGYCCPTAAAEAQFLRQQAGVVPPKCTHGGGTGYAKVIGDSSLSGYTIEVALRFEAADLDPAAQGGDTAVPFAYIGSHAGTDKGPQTSKRGINTNVFYDPPFIPRSEAAGVVLVLTAEGNYTLTNGKQKQVAGGAGWTGDAGESVAAGKWYTMMLSVDAAARQASVVVDGRSLVSKIAIGTSGTSEGAAWLGSGHHGLDFDSFNPDLV
eukprot:SAG11_NODE_819_length_7017_cov_3.801821_7_plen_262_part_00